MRRAERDLREIRAMILALMEAIPSIREEVTPEVEVALGLKPPRRKAKAK
jgi:hypothetical protein